MFEILGHPTTSLPKGPVTAVGGQKALKPSICDVVAFPCVVSTSEMTAIEL